MAKGFISLSEAIANGLVINGVKIAPLTNSMPRMKFANGDKLTAGPEGIVWEVKSSEYEQNRRARAIGLETRGKRNKR
jgi:hypothetical protein